MAKLRDGQCPQNDGQAHHWSEDGDCHFCGAVRCVYCYQLVKRQERNGKSPVFVIYHLPSCKPARNFDKESGKYQIEKEMPNVIHGGYL